MSIHEEVEVLNLHREGDVISSASPRSKSAWASHWQALLGVAWGCLSHVKPCMASHPAFVCCLCALVTFKTSQCERSSSTA